jgi:hypothetical protein
MCMLNKPLYVDLSFVFWPLCFPSFFDLRILITPLVSSNSSYPESLERHCRVTRFPSAQFVEQLFLVHDIPF